MVAPPVEAQLNVDPAELGPVTWTWFDGWIRALAADAVEELVDLPPRPLRQPERPGEASGHVGVRRARSSGPPTVAERNASATGLAWLRKELENPPLVAEVRLVRLDPGAGRSPHLLYARANVHPESPGWVQLQTTVSSAVFVDPGRQRVWLDTLFEQADRHDPGYGQLGFYCEGGATALEDAFDNRVEPPQRRYPEHTIGGSRRALRGYSWVTIVPKELASTVDGDKRLRGRPAVVRGAVSGCA